MTWSAADERAHPAGGEGWWEAWQLDVAGDDVGVAVRLACAPALGVAWWWTHVLLPGRGGPVVVRDHEVALPRVGLEVRADGLWSELVCETPFEHWTYGLEAFGVALDHPDESLRGEIGERVPVGFDLEWEIDGDVPDLHACEDEWPGYEQFGVVHGEVLIGRSRVEIGAVGRRSHRWGTPRRDRATRDFWLWRPGTAPRREPDAPGGEVVIGSFVVPLSVPGYRAGVLTRTLVRSDTDGNGWSTDYAPE